MANPWNLPMLEFASKARRDLRKLAKRHREDAESIRDALEELRRGATNLDVKAVQGHPPWRRLRVGDWRVLYREMSAEEIADVCRVRQADLRSQLGKHQAVPEDGTGWLVARIVNRSDLDRAAANLP